MTKNIPSAEGLRSLPERPDITVEDERVAECVRASGGALSVDVARAMCAAEYGFQCWDNLVGYFALCAAHERTGTSPYNLHRERADQEISNLLKEVNTRKLMTELPPDGTGRLAAVATYVPRLYGLSNEELAPVTLTEAEAQLVVARQRRFMSWSALNVKIDEMRKYDAPEYQRPRESMLDAQQAVRDRNIEGVTRAFRENPEWFAAPEVSGMTCGLAWDAIKQVIDAPDSQSRALLDHLKSLGVNVQAYLNDGLLGSTGMYPVSTPLIRGLLKLGANPHWMPPTGHGVLEHAIVRYMNGEAVDLIAQHSAPRRAFWIAAGLGDVDTMLSFLDANGRPTAEARADRVDANAFALSPHVARAPRPNACDTEIMWEAFMLAGLNGRIAVLDALLQRGFPIDYAPAAENMLVMSVRHVLVDVVEYLLRRGADPHYKAWPDYWSARDMSRVNLKNFEHKPGVKEIHAMLTR